MVGMLLGIVVALRHRMGAPEQERPQLSRAGAASVGLTIGQCEVRYFGLRAPAVTMSVLASKAGIEDGQRAGNRSIICKHQHARS